MPTNYDGISGNVVFSSAMNIASSTNTNPVTVTVSGSLPADFLTGVQVDMQGHQGNHVVNGVHVATVTGASTFTIPVAGVGTGTATGTVQPLNATPFYQIPSDGDADNEASIDTWSKTTGDRDQFLVASIGQFKLARREIFLYSDLTGANWASSVANLTSGTPAEYTAASVAWSTLFATAIRSPVSGQAPQFAISGVSIGDYVTAKLQTGVFASNGNEIRLVLYAVILTPDASIPPTLGAFSPTQGGSAIISPGTVSHPVAITVEGVVTNSATISGNVWIEPVILPDTSGTQTQDLAGDTLLTIDIWRPTNVPQ